MEKLQLRTLKHLYQSFDNCETSPTRDQTFVHSLRIFRSNVKTRCVGPLFMRSPQQTVYILMKPFGC